MKSEKVAEIIRQVMAEKQPVLVPKYLNRKQAADYIGLSGSFVQQMKDQGRLEYYQPVSGGTVRYTVEHLDQFMVRRGR